MQRIQIKKIEGKGILIYPIIFVFFCGMAGCASIHSKAAHIKNQPDIQINTDLRRFIISIDYTSHKVLREAVSYFRGYGFIEAAKRFNELADLEKDRDIWFAMRTFSDLLFETEYIERFSEAFDIDNYKGLKNAYLEKSPEPLDIDDYKDLKNKYLEKSSNPLYKNNYKELKNEYLEKSSKILDITNYKELKNEYLGKFSEVEGRYDYEKIEKYLSLLSNVGEYRASKEIIKLLRKRLDLKMREEVIKALSSVEQREKVIRSIESLRYDKKEERRVLAAWQLFSVDNDWRVIPVFERYINDDLDMIAEISAVYLAKKGNVKGRDAIIAYMRAHQIVNIEFIDALLAGGRDNILKLIDLFTVGDKDFKKDLKQSLLNIGNKVLPYLKERSFSEDQDIKTTCIELIGALKGSQYVEHIIDLSNTDQLNVKRAAISALGEIGDDRAVPYLLSELGNHSQEVQDIAIFSIEKIGEKSLDYLINRWDYVGNRAKLNILKVLKYFNDPSGFDTYIKGFNDEDLNIRNASLNAMAYLKDPRSIDHFIYALKGDRYSTSTAVDGILSFGNTAVDRLIHALISIHGEETEAGKSISMILGRLRAISAVDHLITYIPEHGEDLRNNAALKALINIGRPSVPALIEALKSDNRITRAGSAWALAEIGEVGAVEIIKDMIKYRNPNIFIDVISKEPNNSLSISLKKVNAAEEALLILENNHR